MTVKIIVRDGRAGHAVDSEGNGVILGKFERGSALDEGDVLALGDGTKVMVIGSEEKIGSDSYAQTVFVGSVPA